MAKRYAGFFMTLLASLNVNGSLSYAPGIPFFEDELEEIEQYKVTKTPLAVDTFEIGEIAYTTKIQRISADEMGQGYRILDSGKDANIHRRKRFIRKIQM